MLIMPSFKKSLIVEQFQGNYLKLLASRRGQTEGEDYANSHFSSARRPKWSEKEFKSLT